MRKLLLSVVLAGAGAAMLPSAPMAQNAPAQPFGAGSARPSSQAPSQAAPAQPATAQPAPAQPATAAPAAGKPAQGTTAGATGAPAGMQPMDANELKALERFNDYRKSKEHMALVQRALKDGEVFRKGTCKKMPVKEGRMAEALGIKFGDKGNMPVGGEWREQWMIDRCGTEVIHNVVFRARPNGQPPVYVVLQPGDSALPPNLQEGVSKIVMAEAAAKVTDCAKKLMREDGSASAIVLNTKFGETLDPGRRDKNGVIVGSKWNETWTVNACGQMKSVKISFSISDNAKVSTKVDQVN